MIAVNDAYKLCPEADYLYACDPHWWRHHSQAQVAGERWTQRQRVKADPEEIAVAQEYGLRWIEGEDKPGLGRKFLHYGNTSGYQAINLAWIWGAKRILLLGYDYHVTKKRHFFGDHPGKLEARTNYAQHIPPFTQLAADLVAEGVEVINCSRATALKCFPRASVDDFRC